MKTSSAFTVDASVRSAARAAASFSAVTEASIWPSPARIDSAASTERVPAVTARAIGVGRRERRERLVDQLVGRLGVGHHRADRDELVRIALRGAGPVLDEGLRREEPLLRGQPRLAELRAGRTDGSDGTGTVGGRVAGSRQARPPGGIYDGVRNG
ncbi:hypothetical protein [Cryobacterium sp. TMT2-42-4]|uniref:hypothetical protein n=1 Tax=Cryobacterium sp. TMT2-42-4 TaxID=1259255 RepID=UPI001F544AA8|nr:hypothetical protein [Cryobacterium sp. TMT2-42-4]